MLKDTAQAKTSDILNLKPQIKINKITQRKIVNIFLPILFSICFGCSKEPSHLDGSFKNPQHMFWLRNKKKSVTHS